MGLGLLLGVAGALASCGSDDGASSAEGDGQAADSIVSGDAPDLDGSLDVPETSSGAGWYRSAVFYEVFVRSFQDSDGDGVGDLQGLIDRLDYLNDGVPGGSDLGVDALWLMPIFASPSSHGYDVTDYRLVNPDYGDEAALKALLAACEQRGIRVVLDLVLNHTSSDHFWFVAAAASAAQGGVERDFYVWRDANPGWQRPFGGGGDVWHERGGQFYYGLFWQGMPDLNFRNQAVRDAIIDVGEHWLERGVSGYRLDAVRYLVESEDGDLSGQAETHDVLQELRSALTSASPDVYLVGEAVTARDEMVSYYGSGRELHQAFDFDLMEGIERSASSAVAGWVRGEVEKASSQAAPWAYEATFAGNHDYDRLGSRASDSGQRAGATMVLTLPGTPYIYCGDQ